VRALAQARLVEVAVLAERQRARDRRRRQVQRVRRAAGGGLGLERGALAHAEAVLLVDDGDRQRGEAHGVLDQRMRADDERALAARQAREQLRAAGAGRRTGQQRERHRLIAEQPLDRREVLLGERLGRRHQRRLVSVLDCPQHRVERDHGLAAADLAHQQPLGRASARKLAAQDLRRLALVAGQREGQPRRQPAFAEGPRLIEREGWRARIFARAPGEQRELRQQELLEGEALAAALDLARALAEVHRLERRAALREAQTRAHPRRQRVDDVAQAGALGGDEGEDLRAREPLCRGVVRNLLAGRGRLIGRGVVGDAKAVAALVLAVEDQARARLVALHEPRLVEEGRLHRAGGIGDRRLDQRAHPPPAHRARRDRANLDQHRRRLPRRERADRPRLPPRPRHMLEQVGDRPQPKRLRPLRRLPRQRQRALQARGPRRPNRRRKQLIKRNSLFRSERAHP